jgi:hypothetical protein
LPGLLLATTVRGYSSGAGADEERRHGDQD